MAKKHGFTLVADREIPEMSSRALLYEHDRTGGRVLSVVNSDENKVFGISFRTTPADSTGLPHILEHSVLCGSRKYPVREPFVELLKGSLQTFLNALTFPDKTCYPVASANLQDFYNLVDVYLDAVFFPRLTRNTLRQEGWHYEQEGPGMPLTYKGVVFNEMKGAYSSPDNILHEQSQNALHPDTAYGLDSGGNPEVIPELSFERFMAFHKAHYHPSNAFAFFWGDDDPEKRLAVLDEYFDKFERTQPGTMVRLQPAFEAPRTLVKPYPGGDGKAMVTVNFCLPETRDPELNLALHALEHVLVGLSSSPLRKALLDSELGEDMAGVGLEADIRQMYFSVGLKGVDPEDADKVEPLILRTLTDIVEQGAHPHDVEAAMNSEEFALRENNTGNYPRGLSAMFRALSTWLYDGDPVDLIAFEAPLLRLKERIASGEPVFENLIRAHLIDNPHRATLKLLPDPELSDKVRKREKERLETVRASMTEGEQARLREIAEQLREEQSKPDSPEALAAIPRLSLNDLPRRNQIIPIESYERDESRTLLHDLDTAGLLYLDLGFDLCRLPERLLPYVPLFGEALLEMGTETSDYVTLTKRIARKTGGIESMTYAAPALGTAEGCVSKLFLRCKATVERSEELFKILLEVLMLCRLDNKDRFRQMVLEAKAQAEHRLIPSGHMAVAARLRAGMHEAGLTNELMHGVTNLFYLRELADRVENDFESVHRDLEEMRRLLFSRNNLIINVTASEDDFASIMPGITSLTRALPDATNPRLERTPCSYPKLEALTLPAQVNYVGRGANLRDLGMQFTGAANAVSKFLRAGYLWEKVRVLGGAYGAFSMFDLVAGTLCFVSYRDPNLTKTLDAFDHIGAYLRDAALSHDDIEKSVIGAIGEMDSYMLPDAKGFTSMIRYLSGITDAWRQQVRGEILGTTSGDFRHFAEAARLVAEHGRAVVVGSPEAVQESGLEFISSKLL
ncbi:insulinase family protein [Paucidesulfovibrio longus]|uniref:insulinase family protein n=1 Tax=Paucidesulfovibrio longus TaxID=889 RepID=UPI0003B2E3FE|nr:insulinase family protein [Paucidesulfovibrio longus]